MNTGLTFSGTVCDTNSGYRTTVQGSLLLARVNTESSNSVGSREVDDRNRAPGWAPNVTKDVIS